MEKQEIRYRVTLRSYHQASIYGLVMRNRKLFRVALFLFGGVAFYLLCVWYGVYELNFLPIYLATAYLVYLLILLGMEEQRILRYSKSKDSMIGTDYILRFDDHTLSVEMPKKRERVQAAMKKFPLAVETGAFFLLYVDAATCYIVPMAAVSEEQRSLLRGALANNLGQQFISRYLKAQ